MYSCHDYYETSPEEKKLSNVKYWLDYLIEHLYSKEKLDYDECERCLEELCNVVNVKIPEQEIAIERRDFNKKYEHPMTKSFDAEGWKNWNINYLKSLGRKECQQ